MGKPGAFLTHDRNAHRARPVAERTRDYRELYVEPDEETRREQASRCMMCGVAFCQTGAPFGHARPSGCPLHNLIPEWNDLIWRGRWHDAAERLALTNPLPEFTSRVCPALCEAACNLGRVNNEPTTIHDDERAISDWEWDHGGPRRFAPATEGAPRVAVVGVSHESPCRDVTITGTELPLSPHCNPQSASFKNSLGVFHNGVIHSLSLFCKDGFQKR